MTEEPVGRLERIVVGLYGLPPAEFTAARYTQTKQLRSDGHREAAAHLSTMRRPTTAAWLVNLLVRRHPVEVGRLVRLGAELASAQAALAGPELRELNRRQRTLTAELRANAVALADAAGVRVTEQVVHAIESTLRAAMADDDAARVVASGLLIRDLESSGFEPVEVSGAVALDGTTPLLELPENVPADVPPPAPTDELAERRRARRRQEEAGRTQRVQEGQETKDREKKERAQKDRERARRAAEADRRAEQAGRALADARTDLASATEDVAQARVDSAALTTRSGELAEEVDAVSRRLAELHREQASTRESLSRADRAHRAAVRRAETTQRAVDAAQRALDAAQRAVDAAHETADDSP